MLRALVRTPAHTLGGACPTGAPRCPWRQSRRRPRQSVAPAEASVPQRTADRRNVPVKWLRFATGLALAGLLGAGVTLAASDHGQRAEDDLRHRANQEFGLVDPLEASSSASI